MQPERAIATVLFTDIVGSTERASALGDRRWREVLRRHHEIIRRELKRFRGQEIATAGDGFLAVFDNPARALLCAAAIRDAVRELELDVRCGVHMGEVERSDGTVGGIAVHIGARVAAEAGPGEVLVSGTVRDAEAGSEFGFEDRGKHELKGVPGQWRLYALTSVPEDVDAALEEPEARPGPGVWPRIREAKLLRVLLIYLAASWLILQTTALFIDKLALPAWAMPAAVVLLLIGLAVMGATAWVQSHPLTATRAEAGEVPGSRTIDVRGLTTAVAHGRLPHLTWGRAVAGGVFAFALLFGIAGLYVVIKDRGQTFSPDEAVAENAAPGLAVLPFHVQGAELEEWREGMVDLLSTNLDGVAGLRAIDSRTVLARWREAVPGTGAPDLATALDVGRRAGARYVLVGSAVAIGSSVRLSAEVYDAAGGEELGQGQVEGAPDSVFALVDRLSIEVLRAILKGRGGALPSVNLARVTTSSLPALKAYLEGEVLFRRSEFGAAIPAYERAVEADSTFALALARLGVSYGWAENIGSDLAGRAIDRAARFADALPEREALLVRANHALFHGTLDGVAPLREAVRRFPDDPEAWYLLGDTYVHLGEQAMVAPEEIERAFARATELDPRFAPGYLHRIDMAFILDADSARAAELIEASGFVPGSRYERRYRLALALAFGDDAARARARAELDTISTGLVAMSLQNLSHPRFLETQAEVLTIAWRNADPSVRTGAPIMLSFNQVGRGKLAEANNTLDNPRFPADARADVLYFARQRGLPIPPDRLDRELVLGAADTTAGTKPFYAAAYAAETGRWSDYDRALARLRADAQRLHSEGDSIGARFTDGAVQAVEGYGTWKRGQKERALGLLEASQRTAVGHFDRGGVNAAIRWWLGELLVEMGRPRDAERYFTSLWFMDPLATYRLGRLYQELGEYEKARKAYEGFLTAWRDPDPGLRPLAEQARRAAAGLEPLKRE